MKRKHKRALSLIAALAFVVSMAASTGLDTYYAAPTEPLVLSFEKPRVRR
ncbi:MAG: hypothetical protein K2M42_09270 [Oscillospiraceae bacterium]|nr:hypothetical protein [Oscillospiraceae bacterium]